jgi:hypothetical protein
VLRQTRPMTWPQGITDLRLLGPYVAVAIL